MYDRWIKRGLDLFLSTVALLLLSPIYLVLAVLVRLFLGSPVLFAQERPGRGEKIFKMYKFRSMTDARGADGELLPDDKRLTRFGRLLRASSLDELPELWNIWKGDMSIVGPRPLLVRYLPRYNAKQRRRHEVRPGLTGWAQVNGRNAISWEEKFAYDIEYVEKESFLFDLKIIFMTVGKVLRRSGISQEGNATMEEFQGTKECE
ncbi:MAG: sugar transferase [Eubacterium sp.]|nr:sugar transferase [Eubacterium sp.]